MDNIDKKILQELQKNSSQPLSELSKKVGLSNTPCWNRIKKLEEEKISLYASLCRVENEELFNLTLQLSISDEIRTQDTVSLLSLMSINRNNGAETTWDFIQSNWNLLNERYGSGGFAMMRLVGITGNLLTQSDYNNVEEFFKTKCLIKLKRILVASLKENLKSIQRHLKVKYIHII